MAKKLQKITGFIAIATFIGSSLLLFVALFLYLSVDTSYRPWTHYISELSVGPNNSNIIFHILLIFMAILTIPFNFLLRKILLEKDGMKLLVNLVLIEGLLCDVWLIIMPFYPLDYGFPRVAFIHVIFGTLTFLNLGSYLILIGVILKDINLFPKFMGSFAIIGGVINFLFSISLFSIEILEILPRLAIFYLIEWIGFFCYAIWLCLAGYFLLKNVENF